MIVKVYFHFYLLTFFGDECFCLVSIWMFRYVFAKFCALSLQPIFSFRFIQKILNKLTYLIKSKEFVIGVGVVKHIVVKNE